MREAGAVARALRRPVVVVGAVLILIVVLSTVFADVLTSHSPVGFFPAEARQGPSARHWFGTDQLGRDVFSRVLHGGRSSLVVGAAVVAMTLVVGMTVGGIAGFFGGAIDALLSRLIDVFLAFPFLVGALIIAAALGGGQGSVIFAIGMFAWPGVARLFRGSVIALRGLEFVQASRALGAGEARVFFRHVLPNAAGPTLVYGLGLVGTMIAAESAMSFLGLGVQDPDPSWGLMIERGRGLIETQAHLVVFPSLALLTTVVGFVLLGDGLRDALDPKTR